ncbi:recombinase family protein [Neobacillus drentensis]|uniref:recombinase family protein n=1 Tax=Neobacillus drentensis TaxID=220684 RepID=UPI0008261071|nr:recombinase family protein [Neobacillus drentensis]
MRVAIYTRVSTIMQAEEGQSLDSQLERLKAFCTSQEWVIYKVYTDEGISAKDMERPSLQRLLIDAQKGLFDVLLVFKLDRLSRSVKDLKVMLDQLEKYNVKFKSLTETFDTTTASGRLFLNLVAAMAEWERETIGERIKVVLEHKVKKGERVGGHVAYGYKVIDGKVTIVQDEAEVVKDMFKRILQVGVHTITTDLNRRGVPTRKGNIWHVNTVFQLLRNAFYAGYVGHGEYVSTEHQGIITRDEFDRVQEHLKRRKEQYSFRGDSKHTYIYSGVLRCAQCGRKMNGNFQRDKKRYRCLTRTTGGNCSGSLVSEHLVDEWIFSNFSTLINNLSEMVKTVSEIDSESKLETLERELMRLNSLMEKEKQLFRADLIDMDSLTVKIGEYRLREKEIRTEIESLNKVDSSLDKIKKSLEQLEGNWVTFKDSEKKQLIQELFSEIYVRSTGRAKIEIDPSRLTFNDWFYDFEYGDF